MDIKKMQYTQTNKKEIRIESNWELGLGLGGQRDVPPTNLGWDEIVNIIIFIKKFFF